MGIAARAWVCRNYGDERVLRLAVAFYKSLLRPVVANARRRQTIAARRDWAGAWPVFRETGASHAEARAIGEVRLL